MELTKQSLLQSIEDMGRIYMDFMAAYYGERYVEVPVPPQDPFSAGGGSGGRTVMIPFDFSALRGIPCSVELDVGASSYWSEIASMQTLDNLLMNNRISTAEYLKRLPAGQITDRETLIAVLERQEQLERQMAMGAAPVGGAVPGEAAPTPENSAVGYGMLQRKINETGEVPEMG